MAAIEQVPASVDDPSHESIANALSKLAAVVEVNDRDTARQIQRLARDLRSSTPRDSSHADLVVRALGLALDVFASRFSTSADANERDAYVTARRAVGRIGGAAPLAPQTLEVATALRALANLAAVVEEVPRPFARISTDVRVGYDPGALRERATRSSSLVLELGRERDWKRAGTKAADALESLAEVVEVAPLSMPRDRWRVLVTEIRYQALELRREGVVSLDRSDRIKAALVAATTALANLAPGVAEPPRLLAENASAATSAIDPGVTFVFQRAVIQDAMRSIVDSFVVASARPASAGNTSAAR